MRVWLKREGRGRRAGWLAGWLGGDDGGGTLAGGPGWLWPAGRDDPRGLARVFSPSDLLRLARRGAPLCTHAAPEKTGCNRPHTCYNDAMGGMPQSISFQPTMGHHTQQLGGGGLSLLSFLIIITHIKTYVWLTAKELTCVPIVVAFTAKTRSPLSAKLSLAIIYCVIPTGGDFHVLSNPHIPQLTVVTTLFVTSGLVPQGKGGTAAAVQPPRLNRNNATCSPPCPDTTADSHRPTTILCCASPRHATLSARRGAPQSVAAEEGGRMGERVGNARQSHTVDFYFAVW